MAVYESQENAPLSFSSLLGAEVDLASKPKPDPDADAMLAALQQRMAAAPIPVTSIAKMMVQRDSKRRRVVEAMAAMVDAVPVQVAPLPPEVVYTEGRDCRADDPLFQSLPLAEQQRLHVAWEREKQVHDLRDAHQRSDRLETIWVAYVIFFFAGIPLWISGGLAAFVQMAIAGCITGISWQFFPRERVIQVGSAAVAYGLLVVLPNLHTDDLFFQLGICASFGLTVHLVNLVAAADAMKRSGGFKA